MESLRSTDKQERYDIVSFWDMHIYLLIGMHKIYIKGLICVLSYTRTHFKLHVCTMWAGQKIYV